MNTTSRRISNSRAAVLAVDIETRWLSRRDGEGTEEAIETHTMCDDGLFLLLCHCSVLCTRGTGQGSIGIERVSDELSDRAREGESVMVL
jgi:hypothetical protein